MCAISTRIERKRRSAVASAKCIVELPMRRHPCYWKLAVRVYPSMGSARYSGFLRTQLADLGDCQLL
jgi:hypothetical protein